MVSCQRHLQCTATCACIPNQNVNLPYIRRPTETKGHARGSDDKNVPAKIPYWHPSNLLLARFLYINCLSCFCPIKQRESHNINNHICASMCEYAQCVYIVLLEIQKLP